MEGCPSELFVRIRRFIEPVSDVDTGLQLVCLYNLIGPTMTMRFELYEAIISMPLENV